MKTVALLGGSFDPPHFGHLLAALYVRSVLRADQVWLLPTFHHPFGKAQVAFEHRLKMCEAMAADVGPWLSVHDDEREVKGQGRTVELLEYLLPRHAETTFWWVLGSDIMAEVPKWYAWERVQQLAQVVLIHRAGYPHPKATGPALAEVSSTQVRQRLASGETPQELPRPVLDYIAAHQLYRR